MEVCSAGRVPAIQVSRWFRVVKEVAACPGQPGTQPESEIMGQFFVTQTSDHTSTFYNGHHSQRHSSGSCSHCWHC